MKALSTLAVSSLLLATPYVAAEEQEDLTISGNVSLATDYTFRGVSQTEEKFAIQGGFDLEHSSGLYAGIWASNVDFGSDDDAGDGGASSEVDLYGGIVIELSENVSLDLQYVYYMYPGDEAASNYQEFIVGLGVSDFSFSVVYSDDYFGDGGEDAFVYNADYSLALSEATSLDLHVGYTDADDDTKFTDGDKTTGEYVDYSIGLSHEFRGVTLGLTFVGTDLDDELADERVIFSISKDL